MEYLLMSWDFCSCVPVHCGNGDRIFVTVMGFLLMWWDFCYCALWQRWWNIGRTRWIQHTPRARRCISKSLQLFPISICAQAHWFNKINIFLLSHCTASTLVSECSMKVKPKIVPENKFLRLLCSSFCPRAHSNNQQEIPWYEQKLHPRTNLKIWTCDWNIIMYYTCEKYFRAIWTHPDHQKVHMLI